MRYSADSDDYGVTRRGNNGKKRGKFYDDEQSYVKRDRHLPRLEAEDAGDTTDGLPEGDRWSTWDQSTPLERGPRPHPKWLRSWPGCLAGTAGGARRNSGATWTLRPRTPPRCWRRRCCPSPWLPSPSRPSPRERAGPG